MSARAVLDQARPAFVRDFALVGALSALLAPALVVRTWFGFDYLVASAAAGALFGALTGLVTAAFLGRFDRVPLSLLLLTGPALGLAWGAAVGAAGGLFVDDGWFRTSVAFASVCAAVQFGWFWLPYTAQRVRGRTAWPFVALACAMPVVGYVALIGLE